MLIILASIVAVCSGSTTTETVAAAPSVVPTPPACERAPPHAQPADRHYRLTVAGDPDLFLPGELYTVYIQGVDSGQGPTPFSGFSIWAEVSRDASKIKEDSNPTSIPDVPLGSFQPYDAQTKIKEICAPAADNATGHPKTEIQMIWSAPSMVAGACLRLCARIGPAKNDHWSILARKLCAAPATPASVARQPQIFEPCCACDEAKYEVTFESLWSRNTHPREFPPEGARAHFGEVIGASHTAQYRVWQAGRVASSGMRRLADDGATTALEKELKAESDRIRTIIKARGISWQQIAAGVGIPSTFAVFRVDSRNHLVSLASKLAPSPDWIVGVSALELCAANCTWITSFTLPLYPYDAGTDNGLSYMSRRMPTIPATPVRALRPDWPKDVRSPFFSTVGEMRPFARLRFTRLRLYEKGCDVAEAGPAPPPAQPANKEGACQTYNWGAWSACSVTCGEGYRVRQRDYVYPSRHVADICRAELTQREVCRGVRRDCRAISEYEPEPAQQDGPCAVTSWSEWSPCEGCGVRARTRHYVQPRAMKRCHVGYRARTVLDQAMPCDAGSCEIKPDAYENITDFDWFFVNLPSSAECMITTWGSWSPCSACCGRGRRLRTRLYLMRDARLQVHMVNTLLAIWNKRFSELQNILSPPRKVTVDPEVDEAVLEHIENCQFTLTAQEAICDGDDGTCEKQEVSEDVCRQPLQIGHCRGYNARWYYDMVANVCEPFGFSGCGGNANNFQREEHCRAACADRNITALPETTTEPPATTQDYNNKLPPLPPLRNKTISPKKLKPTLTSRDNEVMLNDDSSTFVADVDCMTGPWLGWTECFGDCEYASKLNYRLVVHPGSGRGKPCNNLMKSRACQPSYCREYLIPPATTTPSPIDQSSENYVYEDED